MVGSMQNFDSLVARLTLCLSIVFSCWRRTLTIAGDLLNRQGIPFVQLDGSLPLYARQEALSKFENDPGISVLLMTLGTGAVGYDLCYNTPYTISIILIEIQVELNHRHSHPHY